VLKKHLGCFVYKAGGVCTPIRRWDSIHETIYAITPFSMIAIDKAENDHLRGMLSKYSTIISVQLYKDALGGIFFAWGAGATSMHRVQRVWYCRRKSECSCIS
jgi:hypothetical protein